MTELVYRFSPGRAPVFIQSDPAQSYSGAGLATPHHIALVFGSKVPGIQPPPPPTRQVSLPQVFIASGVPPDVSNSHFFLPVAASTAKSGPRYGHSPPCAPMMTLPRAKMGAPVNPTVSFSESISLVSQAGLPVFRSSAIS